MSKPILANGYSCSLNDDTADVIYAMDMFHMIETPNDFLKELHRLIKSDGFLIIEDGHQPREATKNKILDSSLWKIDSEHEKYLKCSPINSGINNNPVINTKL